MSEEVLSIATPSEVQAIATVETASTDTTATKEAIPPEAKTESTAEEAPKTAAELRVEELEREKKRLQRGIDRKTRQLSEERARAEYRPQEKVNDSETVTLTRAEIQKMVNDEAVKLAPTMKEQYAETERRTAVVETLTKAWGQDKFNELSNDLDDSFNGLIAGDGTTKPAVEAIFESDNPQAVIEYFADPKNADEAEAFAKLGAIRAGREIAKLEAKLATAKQKNPISKAPAPLENVRAKGGADTSPDPADTKAWIKWMNEQDRKN
jgi:hypothetical protein